MVDPLERGEPVRTDQALTAAPHGVAFLGKARVDDLRLVGAARRAVHTATLVPAHHGATTVAAPAAEAGTPPGPVRR